MYDLIIKGGTIVDGTGNPGFSGDVAIKDGLIAEVYSTGTTAKASRIVDADGLLVTPGWVDIHIDIRFKVSLNTY